MQYERQRVMRRLSRMGGIAGDIEIPLLPPASSFARLGIFSMFSDFPTVKPVNSL